MSRSDIKAKRVAATGSLAVGPARVRQVSVLVDNVGAGRVTITDGTGGSTVLDIDLGQNSSHWIDLADYGVRCETDVFVSTLTNVTALTVLYS